MKVKVVETTHVQQIAGAGRLEYSTIEPMVSITPLFSFRLHPVSSSVGTLEMNRKGHFISVLKPQITSELKSKRGTELNVY